MLILCKYSTKQKIKLFAGKNKIVASYFYSMLLVMALSFPLFANAVTQYVKAAFLYCVNIYFLNLYCLDLYVYFYTWFNTF